MLQEISSNDAFMDKLIGLATVQSSALVGLDARAIHVEVCCSRGPGMFQLVGLAQAPVKEARVRVSSSLSRIGVLLAEHAITVNLAPADLPKGGAALDLAIALGVLMAIQQLDENCLDDTIVLGELSLDGALRPARGVLPQLDAAHGRGLRTAIVPAPNAREAGLVRGLDVRAATHLADVIAHLKGERQLPRVPATDLVPAAAEATFGDMADVRGQPTARRAVEVAAAGGHNLLFIGPPGGGKTLLARLLPTLLPALTFDEALEATAVHSVAGLIDPAEGMVRVRPFRAPHHSVSDAGLVGGGDIPRPGEISLAHHGVLFLDELLEFRRSTLETLRQPLEDGKVCIARAKARAWFPARPLLVTAVNPCPCGYAGHPRRSCRCSPHTRSRYLARLSGPLLDRIDLHVSVPPVDVHAITRAQKAECSSAIRARVAKAREIQRERGDRLGLRARLNSELSHTDLEHVAPLDRHGRALIEAATTRLGLSARAYVRVLRVARTIADLSGSESIDSAHLAEAIQGRLLDRSPTT
ncbi:MAG: YifB family Mg chelatase-like AAA ATPase [Polyangiaceae bacterium]